LTASSGLLATSTRAGSMLTGLPLRKSSVGDPASHIANHIHPARRIPIRPPAITKLLISSFSTQELQFRLGRRGPHKAASATTRGLGVHPNWTAQWGQLRPASPSWLNRRNFLTMDERC
jgi:hypothetical protein